jgi:hypothetical protein
MKASQALRRALAEQAKTWPRELTPVPEAELPERPPEQRPLSVWRSRALLVQVYAEPPHGEVEARRLSIDRVTMGPHGRWDENISWDELMAAKRQTGHGDWYGVEVFPRDRDQVNLANMRHLWLFAEPLDIGWFSEG